ncbi:MAG: CoA pyrophosphatase [Hyphomicrobiales bacterium]
MIEMVSPIGVKQTEVSSADADLADFCDRFLKAFAPGSPKQETGDHMLDLNRPEPPTNLKPAAVLIPILPHADGATVLLTKRTAKLSSHPGQIAFPGGRADMEDATVLSTALREAREEVGLASDQVQLLGKMNAYKAGSGYDITPVIGLIKPPVALVPSPDEVDEIFEVPLSFLMKSSNYQRLEREWKGAKRQTYAIPYETHYIWGVTAGILKTLYETLYRP